MSASTSLPIAQPLTNTSRITSRLYLIRAGLALLWAGSLGAALSSADTLTADSELPVRVGVFLVLYPVLDVVASLVDVRIQRSVGNTSNVRAQLANAAISVITAVALIVAIVEGPASVLRVFGAWAVLTGLIQLALAVNRLRQGLRGQWPMIASGGLSALIGLTFFTAATQNEIKLSGVAGYAVGGAVLYLLSAFRLYRAARSGAQHV